MRMSSLPVITINNVHVEACAERCVRETAFECKSFDIDNKVQGCRLYNDSIGDPFIHLIPSTYVDHYRSRFITSCYIYHMLKRVMDYRSEPLIRSTKF